MQINNAKKEKKSNSIVNKEFDSEKVLERLRSFLKVENNMKLAHMYGMSQNTFYSWVNRNNIDLWTVIQKTYELFPKQAVAIDWNWIIFGIGNQEMVASVENSEQIIQKLTHENLELKKNNEEQRIIINGLIKILGEQSQRKD